MTSSHRSQTVQNPYAKPKTGSQRTNYCDNTTSKKSIPLSSSPSPPSPTSTPSPLSPSYNDFHNALREYCNHVSTSGNGSHHKDLNTSFSISSHAMRQRKLLRNITFELKQLTKVEDDIHANTSSSEEYGGYESLFLKGVGCNSNNGINDHHEEVVLSSNRQIVDITLRVMKSVNGLLVEEYYERREEAIHSSSLLASASAARQQNKHNDLGMTYINNNNHHNFHNVADGGDANADNNDSILAALEFLNVAYSCLESNLVFASLQTFIDCEGFRCVDIAKHENEDEDDDTTDQSDSYTVLDALIYFTLDPHGNGILDINLDETNGHQEEEVGSGGGGVKVSFLPSIPWAPSRTQVLAFSALTKCILNAEFIQRYCTSLNILPEDNIDSLLGNNMGIGLIERHKEDMTRIVQMAMCYLSSIPIRDIKRRQRNPETSSLSPKYQKNKNDIELFRLVCMSLLSCLYRTNASEWMLVQVPPNITKKMILILHQYCSDASNKGKHGVDFYNTDVCTHVSSVLAQSLLLIIKWKSPMSTRSDNNEEVFDEQNIVRLAECVFSPKPIDNSSSLAYKSSIHLFIHLCLIRDESLRRVLKQANIFSIMKEGILQSFFSSNNNEKRKSHGLFMVILHCIVTYPQCRRSLCQIILESDVIADGKKFERFLRAILEKGQDVRPTFRSYFVNVMSYRSYLTHLQFHINYISRIHSPQQLVVPFCSGPFYLRMHVVHMMICP